MKIPSLFRSEYDKGLWNTIWATLVVIIGSAVLVFWDQRFIAVEFAAIAVNLVLNIIAHRRSKERLEKVRAATNASIRESLDLMRKGWQP